MKKIVVLAILLFWTTLCFAKGDGYNSYLATTNKANKFKDKAAAMAAAGNTNGAAYYTNKANELTNKASNMHAKGYGYYKSVNCDKLSDKLTNKWWKAKAPAAKTFDKAANASIASIEWSNWGVTKAAKNCNKLTTKANKLENKAANTDNQALASKYSNIAANIKKHVDWINNTI